MTAHLLPEGMRRLPRTTNVFGTDVLVPFPAVCGVELRPGSNPPWSFIAFDFAERFTGNLCEDCATAAGLRGQLTLALEVMT